MTMDQNLGSANATGTWDSTTGLYDLSWTATLTQGMAIGGSVTWNLEGEIIDASPAATPEPGTLGLLAISLLAMGAQRFRAKTQPLFKRT